MPACDSRYTRTHIRNANSPRASKKVSKDENNTQKNCCRVPVSPSVHPRSPTLGENRGRNSQSCSRHGPQQIFPHTNSKRLQTTTSTSTDTSTRHPTYTTSATPYQYCTLLHSTTTFSCINPAVVHTSKLQRGHLPDPTQEPRIQLLLLSYDGESILRWNTVIRTKYTQ